MHLQPVLGQPVDDSAGIDPPADDALSEPRSRVDHEEIAAAGGRVGCKAHARGLRLVGSGRDDHLAEHHGAEDVRVAVPHAAPVRQRLRCPQRAVARCHGACDIPLAANVEAALMDAGKRRARTVFGRSARSHRQVRPDEAGASKKNSDCAFDGGQALRGIERAPHLIERRDDLRRRRLLGRCARHDLQRRGRQAGHNPSIDIGDDDAPARDAEAVPVQASQVVALAARDCGSRSTCLRPVECVEAHLRHYTGETRRS